MSSVREAGDVLGLDPTSTTAKSTNKVSLSKATAQVNTSLIIVLCDSLILHDIISFNSDTRAMHVNQHNMRAVNFVGARSQNFSAHESSERSHRLDNTAFAEMQKNLVT